MAEKSARSKEIDTELSLEQAKEQITALGKQKGYFHMIPLQKN